MYESFPETVLYFEGLTVDLRVEIDQSVKDALAILGLDGPFGIVTAFNPGFVLSAEANSKSMAEMEAELTNTGYKFVELDACAPDRKHCERSVALKLDRATMLAIAKRWKQLAIFWFDGNHFWIYGAINDTAPLKLPVR